MTVEIIRSTLAWCSVIDIGLLLFWFLFFTMAHDFIFRMHARWFKIPAETFDTIHYTGMAFFKICIFLFNLVPYIALRIIS